MSTILPGNQESAALALDGGMYGLLARRHGMMAVEPFVEKPDCVRIDFTTTSDNYSFKFGYFVGDYISYVELDGSSISWTKGSDNHFTVPTAGSHVVYIKPSREWASNYTFGYFAECDYIRFPYNAASKMLCSISKDSWSGSWKKIDILDNSVLSQVKKNAYYTFYSADVIRVPIGSKQLYADAGLSSRFLDKIVEHNFKYTIS